MKILSHIKWFKTENAIHIEGLGLPDWLTIFFFTSAGLLVIAYIHNWLKETKRTEKIDNKLKSFRPWIPLVARLSTASLLVLNIYNGHLLAPNVATNNNDISLVITYLFAVAAVLFLLGSNMKLGAITLVVGYVLVLTQASLVDVLDHLEYVALAGYFWYRGAGIYSLDSFLNKGREIIPKLSEMSLPFYRVTLGIGLVVLAFSEKFLDVASAQDFLNNNNWNFLNFIGVSDKLFIILAGTVEVLIGLGLILGYATRVLITLLLIVMIVTAALLGINEIYGHLFAVGAVAILLVNDLKPGKN